MSRTRLARPVDAKSPVQSLDKALALLEVFSPESPDWSVTELADKMGMHPSTVSRLLQTLEGRGMLDRDARTGRYQLGLNLVTLGGQVLDQIEVRRHALDELYRLHETLAMNANLAVLHQGYVVHLAYVVVSGTSPYYITPGRRSWPHCTALGKCLLSERTEAEIEKIMQDVTWVSRTPSTIRNLPDLLQELVRVREMGFALDNQEGHMGTVCIAAPIRDRTRTICAALSATGSPDAFERLDLNTIASHVMRSAELVSIKLGCPEIYVQHREAGGAP